MLFICTSLFLWILLVLSADQYKGDRNVPVYIYNYNFTGPRLGGSYNNATVLVIDAQNGMFFTDIKISDMLISDCSEFQSTAVIQNSSNLRRLIKAKNFKEPIFRLIIKDCFHKGKLFVTDLLYISSKNYLEMFDSVTVKHFRIVAYLWCMMQDMNESPAVREIVNKAIPNLDTFANVISAIYVISKKAFEIKNESQASAWENWRDFLDNLKDFKSTSESWSVHDEILSSCLYWLENRASSDLMDYVEMFTSCDPLENKLVRLIEKKQFLEIIKMV
ncbi:hypothetical protein NGRA_1952 [Nosema granulosis]|uniref:Uncharacterized protein n=1 Tax=Nosema granulosis TaxID=83296 RepID=A0A9P6H088_9MICR|nr:hypothetical protein NGRA_1952 [Nosema granulosis]